MTPLVVMALQGYHCARQAILDLETVHLHALLENHKTRIKDWFEERKQDLRLVTTVACTRPGCVGSPPSPDGAPDYAEYAHLLAHLCAGNSAFQDIVAYDKTWHRLAATENDTSPRGEWLPESFRVRLEKAGNGDVIVGLPHFHQAGRIGVHFGVPVRTAAGDTVGYVVAVVMLSDDLYPLLENVGGPRPSSKTFLVSPGGRFLGGPDSSENLKIGDLPFPPSFLDGCVKRAASYRDSRGVPVLGMATPLPELGWVLVIEVDQAEAFAWLRVLRWRAAITALIVVAAVFVFSESGARHIARPFHQLRDLARYIAAGHHDMRASGLHGAEAEEVGLAFNTMLDELAASAQQLVNAGALSAVGRLSSSIVHEMRNPLSSIKLNLAALRETFPPGSDDLELADIALREATRVEGMLNDLLAYSKPLALDPRPTSLRHLIKQSLEHAKSACRNRAIQTRVLWRLPEDTKVLVDEEYILRALCNLIDNAVQFSPDRGTIVLAVHPHAANDDRRIAVRVQDQGPGIPEANIERVFEPFFSTRPGGTGLGLANVKKIVESHGGVASAANHPEGGAVFTIVLPRSDEEET